jgi:hypothetical protein
MPCVVDVETLWGVEIETSTLTITRSASPPVAEAAGPYIVEEGSVITFDGSASYDPDGTIDLYEWDLDGDSIFDTSSAFPTATYTWYDDYSGNVNLRVTDSDGMTSTDGATVTVLNVAPTLTLNGDPGVDEGSVYTLYLSSLDPGYDFIEYWDINWGDGGPVQHILGDPSSVTHTYEDGPNSYIISATATDEDGTYSAAPLTVTVNNVAPTLTICGSPETDEGSPYTLDLNSYDPGTDAIDYWNIDWGDGTPIQLATHDHITHIYADGPNSYIISATGTDEDGTYSATHEEGGFEIGDFTGWTQTIPVGGAAQVVGSHTGYYGTPYTSVQGNYFALLKTDGPGSYTSIQTTVFLYAGQTISGWAAFDSWDYLPFNDNAAVRILNSPTSVIATPWYSDVGIVGDYGDGLWTEWDWTALTDGNYVIEYRIANALDSILDSYALFDMDFSVVNVNNIAPIPSIISAPLVVDEETEFPILVTITDPGTLDWHTYTINWGDFSEGGITSDLTITATHTYEDPGIFPLEITVTDKDGAVGVTGPFAITVLDTTPPDTSMSLSGVLGLEGWYVSDVIVTLDAFEEFSNPTATYYMYDGVGWSEYTGPFTVSDEGDTTVSFYSIDDVGNVEGVKTGSFKIDKTPPVSSISFDPNYYDPIEDKYYITTDTLFTLTANDDSGADAYSGVAQIYYSLDGMVWEPYVTPFSIVGPDGPYLIYYYSVDVAGNEEDPMNTQDVFLISLDVDSYLTDSDFNPITHFDFIFRKNKDPAGFTLIATNPGQFYYHIEVVNTWPTFIDTLTIAAILPNDFILKGAMPIHVYLDGVDITESSTIIGTTVYVSNIQPGSMVWVTIHMDYRLKGEFYPTLSAFIAKSYLFDASASGTGILTGTYDSSSILVGYQKKTTGICGFVTDTDGNPRVGVTVNLYQEDGVTLIRSTVTDANGFYYFVDLSLPAYKVIIDPITDPIIIMDVTVTKDEFMEANFSY